VRPDGRGGPPRRAATLAAAGAPPPSPLPSRSLAAVLPLHTCTVQSCAVCVAEPRPHRTKRSSSARSNSDDESVFHPDSDSPLLPAIVVNSEHQTLSFFLPNQTLFFMFSIFLLFPIKIDRFICQIFYKYDLVMIVVTQILKHNQAYRNMTDLVKKNLSIDK